jgi:excinuclease ABC subunit A
MSPRAFSFNSPHGACPSCQGLGATWDFDPQRIVPNDSLSLAGGAIAPWGKGEAKQEAVAAIASYYGIDPKTPFAKLSKKQRDLILQGPAKNDDAHVEGKKPKAKGKDQESRGAGSVRPRLRRCHSELAAAVRRRLVGRAGGARPVPRASRMPRPAAAIACAEKPVGDAQGQDDRLIASTCRSPRRRVFDALELKDREAIIAMRILKEIRDRVRFLNDGRRRLSHARALGGDALRR